MLIKKGGRSVKVSDADFRKSSFTFVYPPNCVSVARKGGLVAVRDSKDRGNKTLVFTAGEWRAFIKGAKKGEFDI